MSRYYDSQTGRFISPADISSLNPRTINGLNLYTYMDTSLNRNTISVHTSSHLANYSSNKNSPSIQHINSNSSSVSRPPQINFSARTHTSRSLISDPIASFIFGNITRTDTTQLGSSDDYYFFIDQGNDGWKMGAGFTLDNWYGTSTYITSDIGLGYSWQFTPWLTGGYGWSVKDGLSITGGLILGDTTHELTISIGNGVLVAYAVCAGVAAMPVPFARTAAAVAACFIFLIDLFN